MSGRSAPTNGSNGAQAELSYFEQQRQVLVNEVAINLENVLQNMNKLNRSLEGVIAVGNEFGQVEGLWSQFENVMARHEETSKEAAADFGAPGARSDTEGHT